MVGQTISHYRVISKLGERGMAVVYLAEDIHLSGWSPSRGRNASLTPTLSSTAFCEKHALRRFFHQHIATIYDSGKTEDDSPTWLWSWLRAKR